MELKDYCTTSEAAKELGREKHVVMNWIKKKKFPGAVKNGWTWLIPKTEVAEVKKSSRG